MVSLAQLQEVPPRKMVLLVGPPGSGKSAFCQQAALKSLAVDRPIIYVTTEYGPSDAERGLRERGLHEVEPGLLNFVDAYNETVGVSVSDRPDTVYADCNDLSSIDIAISKLHRSINPLDCMSTTMREESTDLMDRYGFVLLKYLTYLFCCEVYVFFVLCSRADSFSRREQQ